MDPIKGSNGQYHRDFRRKIACVEMDFHFCKDRLVISRISLYFCAEFNWQNRPFAHVSTRNHSPGHRTGCRCKFSAGSSPKILDALTIEREGGDLILETQKHIGEDTVRAISMDSTEGLSRGMKVICHGSRHHDADG